MTDFHQRQAISTLTAPAARGLTPHYLVQPGTRHALYPATGTLINLLNYYSPRLLKLQQENSYSCIQAEIILSNGTQSTRTDVFCH